MKKALQIAIGVNVIFVLFVMAASNVLALDEKTAQIVENKLLQAQKLVDEATEIMAIEEQEAEDEKNAIENDLP